VYLQPPGLPSMARTSKRHDPAKGFAAKYRDAAAQTCRCFRRVTE